MRSAGSWAAALVLALPAAGQVQVEAAGAEAWRSFQEQRGELDAAWVEEAAGIAQWCGAHRLRGTRDTIYAAILALAPEHRAARSVLRYVRISGGEWRQSRAYHPPQDRDEDALEEHRARYAEAFGAYRSRVLALIERHRAALGPEHLEEQLRTLLAFDPDDAGLRGLLGETRLGDAWVLDETLRAIERRAAIPALARASLEAVAAPEGGQAREEERALGLAWRGVRTTPAARVLATSDAEEAERVARVSQAMGTLFQRVFRAAGAPRPDLTIYVLAGPAERERLLQGFPGLDAATRAALQAAAGGWLGRGDRVAQWSGDPARRLDGAARQTLATWLMDGLGLDGRAGWAWEGFGLYLVHAMLGTRMTWFFQPEGYTPQTSSGLWLRLQDPALDWLEEGRQMLAAEDAPRIGFLLGRDVNALSERDFLLSYVLAAWLIEGRPEDAVEVSRRIGAGEHPVEAFERALGLGLPQVEARLRRWLDEMRGR